MTLLQKSALALSAPLLAHLKPGDFMPSERLMASEARVGRAVIRGLFLRLQKERLIQRKQNRWVIRLPIQSGDALEHQPQSKRELAKDYLMAQLSAGRLKPGQRLSELALARQLGVSTVTIREALLELEPLGALEKKDRRHWVVATFSESRITQLREFRELVEMFGLRKLLGSPPKTELLALMEANRLKTEQVIESRRTRVKEILEVDLEFHRLLVQASANELLQKRADFIYLIIEFQLVSPHFKIDQGKFGLRQHLSIHRAIQAGDKQEAENHLKQHLCAADESFCAIIRRIG